MHIFVKISDVRRQDIPGTEVVKLDCSSIRIHALEFAWRM